MEEIELSKTFGFEAAHFLPNVPEGHKCRRMHGHSFRFSVTLKGQIDPHTGWLMDFGELKGLVKPILDAKLDHYVLNDVVGLENPTSENIAVWLWNQLKPKLPLLDKITIYETCTSSCVYRGPK
ncbi:queuosine biosynthesis protein QueD [Leptospira wolbachii serovar Codice str. CDC]|uniref:6-carboxy-5,6,7,8-tetrahydropterin synthase n=1 Tax=Leptospira wolbachii serovar Codice str. CDC TaxID=1218599 RepID=R9A5Z0_9LEPT|nr:6-carboxytetrahydropterin synthase QueD [Leptospira wolbachii]EOQ97429.1 queuosine biosynthesis protein QueD [Leptospira wolbachii serovar Codice str. CDC]